MQLHGLVYGIYAAPSSETAAVGVLVSVDRGCAAISTGIERRRDQAQAGCGKVYLYALEEKIAGLPV